ncbi:hypothetical protein M8494_37075 [Serratia ureilytica]
MLPENPASASPNAPILPRVAGLDSGFICVCAALYPLAPPTAASGYCWRFHGFLWPHLAYRLARRAKDPFKAEIRNLLIDSAFGGFWAAMMAFNALGDRHPVDDEHEQHRFCRQSAVCQRVGDSIGHGG